ncbi:hypothetical protein [Zavarzinia compransoris]|uniref:DUF2244 domain-containing protein n=1 Tax=Zavarzinia compransoris TaxID=1264899 RepID=A0A317EAA4_9PROT|nr:hypothetical protein [Zavarzinia compransoris]PWR23879.1 hypothetical protein DKG75_04825 [Zavarzinia compransoris]TDP48120.1 hypothetical protein DES42_102422 [Zavarzinia compransoris]
MTHEDETSRFILADRNLPLAIILVVSALVIGGVNAAMIGTAARVASVPWFVPAIMAAIIAAAVAAGLRGIHLALRRETADLVPGGIRHDRRGLSGTHSRLVPFSDYAGVAEAQRSHRTSKRQSRTLYSVRLVPKAGHDLAPAFDLYQTRNEKRLRPALEAWSRRLSLPVLTVEEDGRIEQRAAADLDRNVTERLRQRTLGVDAVALATGEAPGLLRLETGGGRLTALRLTPVYPWREIAKIAAIFIGFALMPLAAGSYFGVIVALPFLALVGYVVHADRASRKGLEVTADAVILFKTDRAGGNRVETGRIATAAVEEISIANSTLYFRGDAAKLDFGGYLPIETRRWLRARILAFLRDGRG